MRFVDADYGAFLDDVRPAQLENVVPRAELAVVMVLSGRWAGEDPGQGQEALSGGHADAARPKRRGQAGL